MKKTIISLIAVFTIGFVLGFFTHPVLARNYDVQVEVNDQLVTFDEKPYIEKMTCRTYVPIRFIAEKLGANVDWEQDSKTVTILNGNDRICLEIGSKIPTINNIAMAQQKTLRPG
ncbi:MAG: copper amine oxidase N-terminal domain-containing protein [Clostridia bacterium]|nr:copper amine oxidase N-terminal domain-containing protein [Clostridia bacterium]